MANISSDRSLRTLVHLSPPPPRPDAAGGLQHPVGDGGAEAGEPGGAAAAAPVSVELVRDAGAVMVRSTGNCRGWGRGTVTFLDSWKVYQYPRLGFAPDLYGSYE